MNVSGSSGRFSRSSVTQSFMYAVTPHRSRYSSASSEAASAAGGACLERGGMSRRRRRRRQDGASACSGMERTGRNRVGKLLKRALFTAQHTRYPQARQRYVSCAPTQRVPHPLRRVLLAHPLVTPLALLPQSPLEASSLLPALCPPRRPRACPPTMSLAPLPGRHPWRVHAPHPLIGGSISIDCMCRARL